MGEVYLAQDTKLDRKVALKILPADLANNQDRMRRFTQEAKSAAALSHPNIAQIFEIGETDGTHYIAMEFIEGVTLRDKIHREHTELRKLLRHLQHVAEGLSKAHAAGIVHRDLKPDNIMITGDGHAKILDFGLAKLIEQQLFPDSDSSEVATAVMQQHSIPGTVMGTVGYMSPEQAQGKTKEIDHRSDIFSFGCILFEAATGKKPFQGDSVLKSLHMVAYEPAPPITDSNPSAPAELQRIVRRCLEKDPDERYQGIREVAIELKHLRRELEAGGDYDTTVPPTVTSDRSASTSSGSTIKPATASIPPAASSAEYVIQGIKRHKIAAAIAVAILVSAGGLFAYYRRADNAVSSIESIAVLPFENRSGTPDSDYLSDGLAESLIFRLSQVPGLKVSPTSSVLRYKGQATDAVKIGDELGVSAVMSGRMVQRGENLTISVELVDVRNKTTLWGEQFERKMSDLLATQREIATAITERLQLKLSGADAIGLNKHYTQSNDAYQLYLKGRHYYNKRSKEGLERAIASFKQAIELDQNFALAHVGISDSYFVMPSYAYLSPKEAIPQSLTAARRALQIDPDLAEAHSTYASALASQRNWAEVEREFRRALELNPNVAEIHYRYALEYLAPLGRLDESIAEIKRALELEPLSIPMNANLAGLYLYARKNDLALEQALKAAALDLNHPTATFWLGWAYNANGKYVDAISLGERLLGNDPTNQDVLQILGYAYAKAGRRQDLENVIRKFDQLPKTDYVVNYRVAHMYAMLGDKDRAFAELEKSLAANDWDINRLKVDPFMDPLRDDPRFAAFLKRLNLPD